MIMLIDTDYSNHNRIKNLQLMKNHKKRNSFFDIALLAFCFSCNQSVIRSQLLVTSSRAAFYFSFTLVAALVKGEQHLLTSQMENGVLQLNRALLTTGTAYYKPRYTTDLRR
ncbi:uncharacterized protein LOC143449817 [Clavelina lepadiformis]|uniref:uncharacterized protein LOC143449817 n=1 Tax=Clavelina lepadiformis TaxID=159417 RepID=UPI0040410F95